MRLAPDGRGWFRPLNRREAMAVGATSVAGLGWAVGGGSSSDLAFAEAATTLFEHYRRLGQSVTPGLLLPTLIAQTHTLRELARHSRFRAELLRLGSRYAEYVGWLVQETGDDQAALWWTRQAVDLAAAGGDHDLAAYGLVRRALITLYRGDARQTIDLARRAQMAALPPRIRGLAAQREAQGHALAGDLDACMRSLNRANTWLTDDRNPGVPVLGTTNLPDPVGMITGWCLYDLGRPAQAAEALDLQLSYVPAHATRTRVRYGARRALAYAVAGEVEHACALTAGLLPDIARVDSATVAADLRALSRTLNRHPRDSAVRAVAPDLAAALCPRVEPT